MKNTYAASIIQPDVWSTTPDSSTRAPIPYIKHKRPQNTLTSSGIEPATFLFVA
jgi:hypothetical protein